MIQIRIDIIHANRINPKSLHQRRIAQTHRAITQRINTTRRIIPGRAPGLIRDAQQLEAVSRRSIDKVGSLDGELRHRDGDSCAECENRRGDLDV